MSDTKPSGKDATGVAAPPIRPFSNAAADSQARSGGQFRAEIPRRVVDIPGAPRRSEPMLPTDDDTNRLTVGRNICLAGEITACEKLVVDGRVEASLNDARALDISPTGYFKGNAEVDEADISGHFEGTLIARRKLTIRKTGHVSGSVRYGRIVIESGGEIAGDMASLEEVPAEYSPLPERPTRHVADLPGRTE